MAHEIILQPLITPGQSPEERWNIAVETQRHVKGDFARITDEETAGTIADPDNPVRVEQQLSRLEHPPVAGTQYVGIYDGGEWSGVAKVGPWLKGDSQGFDRRTRRAHQEELDSLRDFPERLPRGLHVLAVPERLVRVALTAIRYDQTLVPQEAALRAKVASGDNALHDAFTEVGAQPVEGSPTTREKLGKFTTTYVLRELPRLSK